MEWTLIFEFERDTKRKHRFKEVSEEPAMGTIYVSKDLFDGRPERLEVVLRSLD